GLDPRPKTDKRDTLSLYGLRRLFAPRISHQLGGCHWWVQTGTRKDSFTRLCGGPTQVSKSAAGRFGGSKNRVGYQLAPLRMAHSAGACTLCTLGPSCWGMR